MPPKVECIFFESVNFLSQKKDRSYTMPDSLLCSISFRKIVATPRHLDLKIKVITKLILSNCGC